MPAVDRAHGPQSQTTHGLPTEPLAVVFDLVNRCRHEAGLYLAPCLGSIQFRVRQLATVRIRVNQASCHPDNRPRELRNLHPPCPRHGPSLRRAVQRAQVRGEHVLPCRVHRDMVMAEHRRRPQARPCGVDGGTGPSRAQPRGPAIPIPVALAGTRRTCGDASHRRERLERPPRHPPSHP